MLSFGRPLLLLLAALPALARGEPAPTTEPPPPSPETVPGWTHPAPERAPLPLEPFDGVTLGPGTAVELCAAFVFGGKAKPFLASTLRGRVGLDEEVVVGFALPVFLSPHDPGLLGLGNLAVEASLDVAQQPEARLPVTARLLLPAATHQGSFLSVPARDQLAAGVEGGFGYGYRVGALHLFGEAFLSLYIDGRMPLRLGTSGVATYHIAGPVSAYLQIDPWLVWIPPAEPVQVFEAHDPVATFTLGGLLGLRVDLGDVALTAGWQQVLGHDRDHHLWLGLLVRP